MSEAIEKTLQWFTENEKIFKEQGLKIKELEETITILTEELAAVKEAFKRDIEITAETNRLLEEQRVKLTERAELAEEHLKTLVNLMNLDMY
jgi:hypothetical protein